MSTTRDLIQILDQLGNGTMSETLKQWNRARALAHKLEKAIQEAQTYLTAAMIDEEAGHDDYASATHNALEILNDAHGHLQLETLEFLDDFRAAPVGTPIQIAGETWTKTSANYWGEWTNAAGETAGAQDMDTMAEATGKPAQVLAWGEEDDDQDQADRRQAEGEQYMADNYEAITGRDN